MQLSPSAELIACVVDTLSVKGRAADAVAVVDQLFVLALSNAVSTHAAHAVLFDDRVVAARLRALSVEGHGAVARTLWNDYKAYLAGCSGAWCH